MWVFLSNSLISIVADRNSKSNLLVRARVKGHIETIFPKAKVFTNEHADYLYRAIISRKMVADTIAKSVRNIDYANFKDSVRDQTLHESYLSVWSVMRNLQNRLFGRACG